MDKEDLNKHLIEIYKVTTAESQAIGSHIVQLLTSGFLFLIIILTFITIIYSFYKEGLLENSFVVSLIIIFVLVALFIFIVCLLYFKLLIKVGRTHNLTAFSTEILQLELISGKIGEKEFEKEIINQFPYLNLKMTEEKWFRKLLKKEGKEDLIKRSDELKSYFSQLNNHQDKP